MNRFRTVFLTPFVFALAMALAPAAWAGDAQDNVQARHTELSALLAQPASPARTERLGTLLDRMIDFESIAQESLGNNKEGRTEAELKEFHDLLKQLIKRNYQRNIQKTVNYQVSYDGEEPGRIKGVVVHTKATTTKKNGEVEVITIDYCLHQKDGRWVVFDVLTEQSSMVGNYKNQFTRTIKKEGWNGLITKLKRKLAERNVARDGV